MESLPCSRLSSAWWCDVCFLKFVNEELVTIKSEVGKDVYNNGKFKKATELFTKMIQKNDFDDFLTLPAYSYI